jgi:tRNA threonylcarbamoyladenosine modification (KEOPS) complex Cgi121 subunit
MSETGFDVSRLIIREASAKLSLDILLDEISKANDQKVAIQLFDARRIINPLHLQAAYINALVAFRNGANKSKTIAMEMLMFAAMTNQIGEAIKLVGVKSSSDIIVFSSNKVAYKKIAPLLKNVHEFTPTKQHITKTAKLFSLKGKDVNLSIMQKMAVSRLD